VFKPFVYLAALEHNLLPSSVRDDSPVTIGKWSPRNYTRQYMGPVTLSTALAKSLNTITVRLVLEMGPKAIVEAAQRLGIFSALQPNGSIALGTSEVTPLELIGAFSPFVNGGVGIIPYSIRRITSADGTVLYERQPADRGQVIAPPIASMMNRMLINVIEHGTGRRAAIPGWQIAGKTGTSQDYRDSWFIGYTNDLLTGVWLGNDDSSPTRKVSGSSLPIDVWKKFMVGVLAGKTPPQYTPFEEEIAPVEGESPLSEFLHQSLEDEPAE
jgi:penicillin-binding protein 1A